MAVILDLRPAIQLTDEAFEQLCRSNPDLRLERTAQGELVAMSPTAGESGYYNADLNGQLWLWNRQNQLGLILILPQALPCLTERFDRLMLPGLSDRAGMPYPPSKSANLPRSAQTL